MRLDLPLLFLSALLVCADPSRAAEGGGYLHAGLDGEYFANPTLAGAPSFIRRDVRLDFDWGAQGSTANPLRGPGGSISPAYTAVGPINWSARWTGQLMPRFGETYTFRTIATDGVRVLIRANGAAAWTTLIDAWSASSTHTVSAALLANTAYDFRVEYRQGAAGTANLRVLWSSPSTPEEPIEAATQAGLNIASSDTVLFADAIKSGRDEWRDAAFSTNESLWPARDADGWPLGDAAIIVWEGRKAGSTAGTHRLRFEGRASVTTGFSVGTFSVGNTDHGNTLPFGAGYDAATNTTTADVRINETAEILYLHFTGTRHLASDTTATGVRKVQLMRPAVTGGAVPLVPGTAFHPALSQACRRFSTIRWILNFEKEVQWSDRTRPGYCKGEVVTRRYWEYMIMQANETGKDFYASTPIRATDEYLRKVALMIRYGSDGSEPYSSPQAHPVYPPLNSNLRVYIERSNEIWNWDYSQSSDNLNDAKGAVAQNTPDGQALNFDGQAGGGVYNRWHALRTVQTSEIFRSVFGDAAMGNRVRILLEYQYDNANATATDSLHFLDDYFANARGTSPLPPAAQHPIAYYIWGGGGALYYGAANPMGYQTAFAGFTNNEFESPVLGAGARSSTVPDWTTTPTAGGSSGFYHPPSLGDSTGAPSGGATVAPNAPRGLRFTVGPQPLHVNEVGRWVSPGNNRSHSVTILRASDLQDCGAAQIATSGVPPGRYAYGLLSSAITLEANTSYYLISTEDDNDLCLDSSATLSFTTDLTIDGAVSVTTGDPSWDTKKWIVNLTQTGAHGFGPLTLHYTTATVPGLGLSPWPRRSPQAAYLLGPGTLSTTVHFPTTGVFAFAFDCAVGRGGECALQFSLDGQNITPDSFGSGLPGAPWSPGGWARDQYSLREYTTAAFTISTPGPHTLEVAAVPYPWLPSSRAYLDHLQVLSLDALFASGIPGAGEANGQVGIDNYFQQLRSQGRYAQAYGLKVTAYEGGWSLGGDFGQLPVQQWAKYRDPRTRPAQGESIDIFAASGGNLYTFGTYEQWFTPDTDHADTYPIVQAIDDRNVALPLEAAFGFTVPQVLTPSRPTWSRDTGAADHRGSFLTWNVLAPQRAQYPITVASSLAGGTAQLLVDGWPVGAEAPGGAAFTRTVLLGKGLHAVQVRTTSAEAFALDSVTIALPGTLPAPASITADDGDAQVAFAWSAVPGASGYRILWGATAGMPDRSSDLSAGTISAVIEGLSNNTTYYFRLVTLNAAGPGLPSPEIGRMPFANGESVALATWQFATIVGNEPSAPATSASTRAAAIPLTRGSGLEPIDWIRHDCFAGAVGNWPTSLAEAKTRQVYLTYGISPVGGLRLSLEQVDMRVFWQNWETGSPYRDSLAYSTDGGATFTDVALPLSEGEYQDAVVDLSGVAALQNTSESVLFRVYFWNIQSSCTVGVGERNHPALRIFGSVAAGTTPRDAWRLQHFGSENNVGPGADFADPDLDGLTNLLEYAVGTDPHVLGSSPTTAGTAAGKLTLTFTRRRDATDVTYHVEAGDDLANWKEIWSSATNPYPGGTALSAPQLVTDTMAPAGATRRFLRLRVTAP